jgi:hypothetical protein
LKAISVGGHASIIDSRANQLLRELH